MHFCWRTLRLAKFMGVSAYPWWIAASKKRLAIGRAAKNASSSACVKPSSNTGLKLFKSIGNVRCDIDSAADGSVAPLSAKSIGGMKPASDLAWIVSILFNRTFKD